MTDYIGYDALTQAAMRGVVREALRQARANGEMPGDHHFYVTFRTKAPGVKIADYLVERFPEDMTIVVQHQYWDLEVDEGHFEIVLKFNGVPQHLFIPFSSITRFVDPSVNFFLTFEQEVGSNDVLAPAAQPDEAPAPEEHADTALPTGTVVKLDAFRQK